MSTKPLTIDEKSARAAYQEAGSKGKTMLENLFGNQVDFTKPMEVKERIKTLEDAFKEVYGEKWLEPYNKVMLGSNTKDEKAYMKLKVIALALNEGWKPDYSDANQAKYYPWFKYSSGSGFRCHDFGCDRSGSYVGARLCYRTRELAEYAGKQFESIYNDFLNLK